MKRIFLPAGCVPVVLMTSLAVSAAANAAAAKHKTIACPFLQAGSLTFDVPVKRGGLPLEIDFDYPVKATQFSFRDGNLLLVAMDEGEPARLRVVVSAQRNKKSGAYDGQIFVDMGGNQLMLHNGPVRCTVGAARNSAGVLRRSATENGGTREELFALRTR